MILVSICCITYNHEGYIRQCLDGFLIQATSFQFEILIHDDASTDKTSEIIREYELKYPEIIKPIYQTENQYSKGVRPVNKFNFERACGKYIALCEGDDYWTDPLKLQKQVDFLEVNEDCSMCFHNAMVIYDDNSSHIFNKIKSNRYIRLEQLIGNWIVPTASIVFRRNILPMPDWSSKIYSGDMTLALTAFNKGKIYYFTDIMSVYRKSFEGHSISAILKDSGYFKIKQYILLLNYFNQESNFKYSKTIKKEIRFRKKLMSYADLRRKTNKYTALLLSPSYVFGKMIRNFLNK